MSKSTINPKLTLEYILTENENKYFDRKSARIKPSDLAGIISAFANAEGGTIVIGVSDKTKRIEGVDKYEDKISDLINSPKSYCKPMPFYDTEFLDVVNENGEDDRILLLHIHSVNDQIIRTTNDSTYLRIGDKTREIKGDDLRNLEYSKNTRHYEDEINVDANIDDLDPELLNEYKIILNAKDLSDEQILKARGFIREKDGKSFLTNAAVLLFAKNISQFYPNCRIRFVRYDGKIAQVGTRINIVKDVNIEQSLLRIIGKAKDFISTQLRDFVALNKLTGKFEVVPEYPEFAWLEGIVNAVTHREYAMLGNYISVFMYDDRLEILSPGKLPNIVTVQNITETRYSRNPRIARVLTEFGWVRELNEGVKRIYSDMKEFFLKEPVYSEPEQSVKLVLENNIVMRKLRLHDRMIKDIGQDVWDKLDESEKSIVSYLCSCKEATRNELEVQTGKSASTVTNKLKKLIEHGIVKRNGNTNDPTQTYSITFLVQ